MSGLIGDVALKMLPVGTLADEGTRTRFRKEALALAKLDHPNVATIPEFGSQSGVVRNRCSGPIAALPHTLHSFLSKPAPP